MTQQIAPATNVFDAAKAIVEVLKDMEAQQQRQAIRFASESLGLLTDSMAQSSIAPPPGAVVGNAPSTANPTHSTDIKQFVAAKSPKSDQQFAAVAAYFYQFEAPQPERKDAINLDDLKNAARLAKRPVPGRFVLNNAKNSGYFNAVGQGQYKLSTVGENLVAITLPGNGSEPLERSGGRKKSKRKVAKTKGPGKKRTRRGD